MKTLKFNFSYRQLGYLITFTVVLVVFLIITHEAAHVLTAVAMGVPFSDLKLGFWGINPSITLPRWISDNARTAIFYAGGLTAGSVLLLIYIFLARKYRREPSLFYWALGVITIMFAAEQVAAGYLEGRYHGAYLMSATTLFSPADILTYGWMLAAVVLHSGLCPGKLMKNNKTAN